MARKPVIGITPRLDRSSKYNRYTVRQDYVECVAQAGGTPVILSYTEEAESILSVIDGLLLSGGGDVDPWYFQQEPLEGLGNVEPERDHCELELAREVLARQIPVLGICRGMQVLNIASGGTIYQDLGFFEGREPRIQHRQKAPDPYPSHTVQIRPDSLLFRLQHNREQRVNTMHHQAVEKLGDGFKVTAQTADSVIEAIEHENCAFAVGVQWHPERLADSYAKALFCTFVRSCTD